MEHDHLATVDADWLLTDDAFRPHQIRMLTARRYDLAADRTRAINRLRACSGVLPRFGREFGFVHVKWFCLSFCGAATLSDRIG
ncbi:hypothetical protein ACIPUC_00410 [Streptomyces sp. LARHCF249]